jgi:uncharacterized protein
MPVSIRSAALAAVLAAAAGGAPTAPVAAQEVSIGTGSPAALYFQVGRSICRILNRVDPVEGLSCSSLPTAGSAYNLDAIRSGALTIGVVQSDLQYDAVHDQGAFAGAGPDEQLRSLFSVHTEPFTLVVRRDSDIRSIADLQGRRVNIGNPGSGQRATMELVMEAMGWTTRDFALASQLPSSEHSLALCHDRVEAIVFTVGHPNPSIAQATGLCDATIVEVSGPEIDNLVKSRPYFFRTEIPGGIYAANPEAVPTFGVVGTVVASADLDEETAYRIVSRVFENIDVFRRSHPAFGGLDEAAMRRDGLFAPLHPGAERYFREQVLSPTEPEAEFVPAAGTSEVVEESAE